MRLLEAIQRHANQEHEKCEGKFLYISCGRGESEIKLTPALLSSPDWAFTFEARGEFADIARKAFEEIRNSGLPETDKERFQK